MLDLDFAGQRLGNLLGMIDGNTFECRSGDKRFPVNWKVGVQIGDNRIGSKRVEPTAASLDASKP